MREMAIRICAMIFGLVALQSASASADTKLTVTSDPLNLGETNPATVYVALKSNKPAFSLSQSGVYHTGGIKWKYDKKKPKDLSITFVLSSDISKIKSKTGKFSIGPVTNGQQTGTVKAQQADDHFTVVKASGDSEDPKIIVNPQ